MKRHFSLGKIISFILILTIIALIMVSGTYARFASIASGTSATVVANWSFEVNGQDITILGDNESIEFGLFDTINDSDGVSSESDVESGFIAPGTGGSFEFIMHNTSDVTAQYAIYFESTNLSGIPIQYSTDGINWSNSPDILPSASTILPIGSSSKSVILRWKWSFDGNETIDTNLGTLSQAPTITLKATVMAIQVNNTENNYSGKIVSVLGDSISTLKGYIPSVNRARYVQTEAEATGGLLYMPYEKTWWGRTIEELDMTLGINQSWAGSRVSNTSTTDSGDYGPNRSISSMTRLNGLDDNGTPDVILFYGGTNDIGGSVTLGTFNTNITLDLDATIFNNVADAYAMTILRLKHLYPGAEIIALLPTYTTSYYTTSKLIQYNAVFKQICNYYGVKYLDLTKSGITTSHLADGIHPNEIGMQILSDYLIRALQTNSFDDTNSEIGGGTGTRTTSNSYAQALPSNLTSTTNLYNVLTPDNKYYDSNGVYDSYQNVVSVTVPVVPGDKLYSNSIRLKSENGHTQNGIRVTYLNDDAIVSSIGTADIYAEYSTYGYITVPSGVNAVNMPWWSANSDNFLYILSAGMSSQIERTTGHNNAQILPSNLTSTTNLYEKLIPVSSYYDSTGQYVSNSDVSSVIIPVVPGDVIYTNSMRSSSENNSVSTDITANGVRLTFLLDNSVVSTIDAASVYQEYLKSGFITVPSGANAANVVWYEGENNSYQNFGFLLGQ